MGKRLNFGLVIMLAMVLVVSCAPRPVPEPPTLAEIEAPPEESPVTGEASIDEVAADISDAENIDEELDTSGLDDVEDILADIENI